MTRRLMALALLAGGRLLCAETPRRIVSAAPSITEMLYALGAGERVVGVTTFCHYPPEVREKPKIGSYLRPNIESVLSLRPDLVVALEEHGDVVGQLRSLGLTVAGLQHNDLEGVYSSLRKLGHHIGAEARAERLIAKIRAALAAIERLAAELPRRRVLFVVGRTPGTVRDLVAVGRGSFLNELITIAGGENLFAHSLAHYPKIPREEVLAGRPEVIIDMGDMSDTDEVTEQHKRRVAELWKQFPSLPAVREGRVYAVAEDIFVVPGPRVIEAAEALLRMIHPEAAP